MTDLDDTIAAAASAAGPAVRAIIRISGPRTQQLVGERFVPDDREAWRAARRPLQHSGVMQLPGWRTPVPASVLLWPGHRSYTGQPAAELQLPGCPPLVNAVLRELYAAGARPARAGEFTLRSFLAGRIDLTQAEAVLGVIDAEDHVALRQALEQLAGGLAGRIAEVREQLLLHLADLEAGLDFVDEDLEFVQREVLNTRLMAATDWLSTLERQAALRLESSDRRQVVLAGLPNAGKSTLFNRLAGASAAIVSPERGTTRDVLCRDLEIDGQSITLWDTAGWEVTRDPIEQEAGDLRLDRIERADLILWCTAADASCEELRLDAAGRRQLPPGANCLRVRTKGDRARAADAAGELLVSAVDEHGLPRLLQALGTALQRQQPHHGELLGSTAARCQHSLRQARVALQQARSALAAGEGDELIALSLRAGLDALGAVCGAVHTDDVLDRIFSRFCIGK